jgi:Trk K+ transport system NAD-binding subunit
MQAIVIGCGRVGSSIARQLFKDGWDVTAIDEKEDALARLGDDWRGGFVLGHGMDVDVLRAAGIEDADAASSCACSIPPERRSMRHAACAPSARPRRRSTS